MWGLRVPVCDEEHCGMAPERLRSILMAQESRRNSSRAPSLCEPRAPGAAISATFLGLRIERNRFAAISTRFFVADWYALTGHEILSICSQSVGP